MALKLKAYTETEWLAWHRRLDRVTASQVPTILGVNRYESPFTLFQRKQGRVQWQDETRAMRRGHYMEPFIADEYERQEGVKLHDPGNYTLFWNSEFPELLATPDRQEMNGEIVTGDVVEAKAPGIYAIRNWDDGPPLAYMVQVQAQLYCTGGDKGHIAGLVGDELLVHEYGRDDKFIKAMLGKIEEFIERLVNDDAPDIDGSESSTDTLKELHPDDNDLTVDLPEEAIERAKALWDVKAAIKTCEKEKKDHENWFKDLLGPGAFGELGNLKVSYKTVERKGYEVKPGKYRKLNVSIKN